MSWEDADIDMTPPVLRKATVERKAKEKEYERPLGIMMDYDSGKCFYIGADGFKVEVLYP